MNFLGFGNSANFVFKLNSIKGRPTKTVKHEGGSIEELVIFQGDEPIRGEVTVVPKGKKVEHIGIKIELVGQIEFLYDRGNPIEFTSLVRELAAPGVLYFEKSFEFDFSNVEKKYESYNGLNVQLRYFLRATVSKPYGQSTKEQDFWVQSIQPEPVMNNNIKMEVGIEDCLHIEFEYEKSKYHLHDSVVGKIFFQLVRLKLDHMEINIQRWESTGSGMNKTTEKEILSKFEIMDGSPVREECIPVRLYLDGKKLTPSYDNVNNMFSVRYFLNLVLVDQSGRRYFKAQEITLWRKDFG
mmetsp:Transcript_12966/g.33085  ORF Transcript_12966/g.33085 Transcript_12966/m.33085 type:complete len:297 (-) Transcript_12966:1204-2094(-)